MEHGGDLSGDLAVISYRYDPFHYSVHIHLPSLVTEFSLSISGSCSLRAYVSYFLASTVRIMLKQYNSRYITPVGPVIMKRSYQYPASVNVNVNNKTVKLNLSEI